MIPSSFTAISLQSDRHPLLWRDLRTEEGFMLFGMTIAAMLGQAFLWWAVDQQLLPIQSLYLALPLPLGITVLLWSLGEDFHGNVGQFPAKMPLSYAHKHPGNRRFMVDRQKFRELQAWHTVLPGVLGVVIGAACVGHTLFLLWQA